jgi:hypothetical protein
VSISDNFELPGSKCLYNLSMLTMLNNTSFIQEIFDLKTETVILLVSEVSIQTDLLVIFVELLLWSVFTSFIFHVIY